MKSKWAIQRTEDIKTNLERVYGRGLTGMINEKTGMVDPSTFGRDNRLTGGKRLGSSISITITDGLTIDAATGMAWALGFSKGMQYEGLSRETDNLPGTQAILTNCFAATYGFMTSVDIAGHNRKTITENPGQFKGFDVLVLDPTHIFADFVVGFEMCEFEKIVAMVKNNASLDYASIAETSSRFILVLMLESPEARDEIMKMRAAGECAKKVKEDYDRKAEQERKRKEEEEKKRKEEEEWQEFGNGDQPPPDSSTWDSDDDQDFSFLADADVFNSEGPDAEASARAAASCFDAVNRYTIGEISGKLFAHLFNNELKPLV